MAVESMLRTLGQVRGRTSAFGESGLTRASHRVDRHVEATGHRTHLVDGLPQQQVEPADQRVPARQRLLRQRRRPRVVDHVEHDRVRRDTARTTSSVWAAAGTVETTRSTVASAVTEPSAPSGPRSTSGGCAWRPTARRCPAARAGSRTANVACSRPRSASASTTEAAVAPPPSTTARRRSGTGDEVTAARAASAPGTSVFETVPADRPRRAATCWPHRRRGPLVPRGQQRHRLALERHRQGEPPPLGAQPVDVRREPAGRDTGPRHSSSPARARRTPPGAGSATTSARSGHPGRAQRVIPAPSSGRRRAVLVVLRLNPRKSW